MKKQVFHTLLIALLVLTALFFVLFCYVRMNYHPFRLQGIAVSEDSRIKIIVSSEADFTYDRAKDFDGMEHGILIQEDGSERKIVLAVGHGGSFSIYEYNDQRKYDFDVNGIYKGSYRQQDDTLVLITEEGECILLKKVDEVPQAYYDGSICTEELLEGY